MSKLYFDYFNALTEQGHLSTNQIRSIGAKYNASSTEMAEAYTRAQYVIVELA